MGHYVQVLKIVLCVEARNVCIHTSYILLYFLVGSLILHTAGAGVYCKEIKLEKSSALGKYSSIFFAEIRAILECCDEITDWEIIEETIHMCSDSQAALKTLSSVDMKSAPNTWMLEETEQSSAD